MSVVEQSAPRVFQPQDSVGLNTQHQLAAQIRLALTNAGNTRDVRRGVVLTKGTSASFQAYPIGWAQKFSGSAVAGTTLANGSGLAYLLPITIPGSGGLNPFWGVIQVWIQSLGTRRVILADFSNAGSNASIRLEQQAADTWIFGVSDGGSFFDASGGAVTIGAHTLVFWQDAGDRKTRLIVDGGPTLVSSTAPAVRAAGTDLRLGSAGAFTTLPFDGGVTACVIGEGNPTEYQMRALCARPWDLFAPESELIYVLAGSHAATGALAAGSATVAGSATHLTLHASSGAPAAQSATVAGAAVHPHVSTGALTAQDATVAGAATHPHTSSGALAAGSASVAGSATRLLLHASAGALLAADAIVVGSATVTPVGGTHPSTGSLADTSATVAGTATHYTLHTSSGALSSQPASVAGVGQRLSFGRIAAGVMSDGSAQVAGFATRRGGGLAVCYLVVG